MSRDQSEEINYDQDLSIDFDKIAKFLWRARTKIAISVMVYLSIAFTYLAISYYNLGISYIQTIQLRFPGLENEKYPNGQSFNSLDIITPENITILCGNIDCEKHNVTNEALLENLSINPVNPRKQELLIRLNEINEDKKATFSDKQKMTTDLANQIESAKTNIFEIKLHDEKGRIPSDIGKSIVYRIPQVWAEQAKNQRRILDVLGEDSIHRVIPLEAIKTADLDLLNKIVIAYISLDKKTSTLIELGVSAKSQSLGLTARDAANEVAALKYDIFKEAKNLSDIDYNLTAAVPVISEHSLDGKLIHSLDYLVALDLLSDRIKLLKAGTIQLEDMLAGTSTTDPVSKLNLQDIKTSLNDIEQFQIDLLRAPLLELGISKDKDRLKLYYDAKIRELERKNQVYKEKTNAIQTAESRYTSSKPSISKEEKGNTSSKNNTSLTDQPTNTIIPQFGDSFIDRLISLSEKGGDVKFRQDLSIDALKADIESIEIQSDIERTKTYLDKFANKKNQTDSSKALTEDFIIKTEPTLDTIIKSIREISNALDRISRRISYARLISSQLISLDIKENNLSAFLVDAEYKKPDFSALVSQITNLSTAVEEITKAGNAASIGYTSELYSYQSETFSVRDRLLTSKAIIIFIFFGIFSVLAPLFAQLIQPYFSKRRLNSNT